VFAAALPDGAAVAVKVADGATRAAVPVLVAGLRALGIEAEVLTRLATTPVLGGGVPVRRAASRRRAPHPTRPPGRAPRLGRRGPHPRPGPMTAPGHTRQPSAATVRRWRQHLADERLEAAVYRELAARKAGEERDILLALADAEARHAAHWTSLLGDRGPGRFHASLRSRLLALLARRFGSVFVLALAQRAESRSPYDDDADATPTMAADEKIHAEVVRGLAERGRAQISGTFRAAVFGANDGLVSNLALVLGVAGSGVATTTVLLTGLAGLLSGALSMGAGEYISVRSQRELLDASTPGGHARRGVPPPRRRRQRAGARLPARGMAADEAARPRAEQLRSWPAVEVRSPVRAEHELVGSGVSAARVELRRSSLPGRWCRCCRSCSAWPGRRRS
jgi:hypothetical protein